MSEHRTRVGCLFGSFNPVHNGHLIIAEYMATQTDLSRVLFVVSPQNPHKSVSELADDDHRLEMTRLAIERNDRFELSNVEFDMPKPSFTIDTLQRLDDLRPETEFTPIIGSDNLSNILTWKDGGKLLDDYGCYVYIRPGHRPGVNADHPNVRLFDTPLINISATYIRSQVSAGRSVRYLVPEEVISYIGENGLYR